MKYPENIQAVASLLPDYMGFIFYEKSDRYVQDLAFESLSLPEEIKKTGVFVNVSSEKIAQTATTCHLDAIQLHGKETPEDCLFLREKGFEIIKSFSIKEEKDLLQTEPYSSCCDFLLFDTPTAQYGGSGKKFDWRILQHYHGETPFFLSGGIAPDDMDEVLKFNHPFFYGIDINSRFETKPGMKDFQQVKKFIINIREKA